MGKIIIFRRRNEEKNKKNKCPFTTKEIKPSQLNTLIIISSLKMPARSAAPPMNIKKGVKKPKKTEKK
jgi:hypothetical protein